MRLKMTLKPLALVAVLMLAGCGLQPGKSLATQELGKPTSPASEVVAPGTYALYPKIGTTPIATIVLGKGDEFGFKTVGEDTMGYALKNGTEKLYPLKARLASTYIWKLQAD